MCRWLLTQSLVLVAGAATAQTPTAEQLQIFNSLDPSQQQSVLQNLGQSRSGTAGSDASTKNPRNADRAQISVSQNGFTNTSPQFGQPALKAGDSVLIDIDFPKATTTVVGGTGGQPAQVLTIPAPQADVPVGTAEREKLQQLITLVRSKNPYRLGADGALQLPGFLGMSLSGLTVEQATARLAAEPSFQRLQVKINLLPIEKTGVAALKPFGYDLFNDAPSTFAPMGDVPVPADYIVGPGDELVVQLYGSTNRTLRLTVGRDGRINFPELGPIGVSGQSFSGVQSTLEDRVTRQMIGVKASISMAELRSIRIFVLGEANAPGAFTVSGLATMTTALFASGGVKPIGSLRNVQLKRQGNLVRTLDLYDLLLKGDTSDDAKLMPGDVIFIPPVGATVAVDGAVQRPAIYEVKGNTTAADVITLAGGLTAEADARKVAVTRIDAQRQRVALDLDLDAMTARMVVRNGDSLVVPRLTPQLDSAVTLEGHLYNPRSVAWRAGLNLSDVISSVDELKPNADTHYLLIRRELPPDREVAVLSADLSAALAGRGGLSDVALQPRDRITVFDFETDRSRVIKPILDDLRLQSRASKPTEVVRVEGRIKVPGEYPLEPNMRISDLIRAGGNLQDAAFISNAELTRYVDQDGKRITMLINVDLAAISRGDAGADIPVQSADMLIIKELPQWSQHEQVTLKGEVRFPGTYSIQRGETLKSVIQRAGGLTEMAFSQGSVFTREDLRQREQQQLDLLANRMQSDLAVLALQSSRLNESTAAQSLSVGQSLLTQLKASKAVGRLVVDVDRVVSDPAGSEFDVILRNGDVLMIPKLSQEVTVLGEVQTTTSLLYRPGLTRDEYINQSGGMTRKADGKQIYVVRANGSVVSKSGSRWFQNGVQIKPGDTIVVPMDTERLPALPLWQAVTQVVYNIAIAAAAVNSF